MFLVVFLIWVGAGHTGRLGERLGRSGSGCSSSPGSSSRSTSSGRTRTSCSRTGASSHARGSSRSAAPRSRSSGSTTSTSTRTSCCGCIGAGDLDIESAGRDGPEPLRQRAPPGHGPAGDLPADGGQRAAPGLVVGSGRGRRPGSARRPRSRSTRRRTSPTRSPSSRRCATRVTSPRGVRGEEGRAARAHVSARAVVSLVPSATETLLALGVTPDRVHPLLRAARDPDGRRHEGPARRRDRRARAGPRRGERRGEPARGLHRAAARRARRPLDVAARRSATSGTPCPRSPIALGVAVPPRVLARSDGTHSSARRRPLTSAVASWC